MRRYSLFVVAFAVAAVCVRLGFWQVDRLRQRQALNAALEGNRNLPVVDLSTPARPDQLPRFRRVRGTGAFDFEHQVIVDVRSFDGTPAVVVVTPLRLPGGVAVLVERGWVLSLDAHTVDLGAVPEPDSAMVSGLIVEDPIPAGQPPFVSSEWPRHVQWLHPGALSPFYPYPLLPYVVRRTELPPNVPRGMRPVPVPALDNGPHLSYAIQWFAFAVIAVVGAVALFRREEGRVKAREE